MTKGLTMPSFNLEDEMINVELRYMKVDMQNYLNRPNDWFIENALKDKFTKYKNKSPEYIMVHLELEHNPVEDAKVILDRIITQKETHIIDARAIEAIMSSIEFENGKAIGYWLNGKLCL